MFSSIIPVYINIAVGSMAMDATKEDFDELFRDAASLPVQTRIALWSAICALRRDQASKAAAVAEARESAKAAAALAQQRNFSPMHVPTGAENREESKNEDSVGMTFARSAADEAGKYVGSQGARALFSVLF
ncbi:hypothetical protein EON65_32735 [archaeon]|nr:MAG: hypothetical protein EON65_32735 [archaeon]